MARRPRQRTSPVAATALVPPACALPGLTDHQVDRWAGLIADGRDSFPDGLAEPDRERLLAAVRVRLRDRLVRYIARAIVARLRRARRDTEESTDART